MNEGRHVAIASFYFLAGVAKKGHHRRMSQIFYTRREIRNDAIPN